MIFERIFNSVHLPAPPEAGDAEDLAAVEFFPDVVDSGGDVGHWGVRGSGFGRGLLAIGFQVSAIGWRGIQVQSLRNSRRSRISSAVLATIRLRSRRICSPIRNRCC